MIEDDPARANFEYAQFVEQQIELASNRLERAREELNETVERRAEIQIGILEGNHETLKEWLRADDNVRAIRDELREMVPSGVYPNDSPYFDEPHDKDLHQVVLDSTPMEMLEEMYKLGSRMQEEKLRRDRLADALDMQARQLQKELDLLLEREEPLGWDVENRRMEVDRAIRARNHWPDTGTNQGIRPRPHPGLDHVHPVPFAYDPSTGDPVYLPEEVEPPESLGMTREELDDFAARSEKYGVGVTKDAILVNRDLRKNPFYEFAKANDNKLALLDAKEKAWKEKDEALNAEVAALRAKVASGDHRQIRKFRKLPGKSERKGVHPFFNNAINALNTRQRDGTLEGRTFTVSFAPKSKKYADAHPREMLALRHGIVHPKGPLEFKVFSRMDEDQNNLHVWIEDYQKDAYVAIYVTDNGTWEITTALHEVKAWVDAENDLYPGIKHEVGQYTLKELAIKHREIAAHLEANSDIVA